MTITAPKAIALLAAGLGGASAFSLSMNSALIVQNKGGGHGELGFQLAKTLSTNPKITSITILQDSSAKDSKEPFRSYSTDLPDVKVIKADLADDSLTSEQVQSLLGQEKYDYIWDNASKSPAGSGLAVLDCARSWNSKLLTYVSSAGIYVPSDDCVFPMSESTPVKESAGQARYEKYALDAGLPLVSFRPQYIYGPKSNKWDYVDYFFDRLVRNEPIPIPGDGKQKVSLTNSRDVASLLASVLNDEDAAKSQTFFNCGTDELASYDDVALMCAKAAGCSADIRHYDPSLGKASFPFRLTDFYVAPDMAKEVLGWEGPKYGLVEDLGWYFESYKERGGMEREVDLSKDREVLAGANV